MSSFPTALFVWVLGLGTYLISAGTALGQVLPSTTPATAAANNSVDPLGRATPTGTMLGFLQAAQAGDYGIAAQYLQMSPARRQAAMRSKVLAAAAGRFINLRMRALACWKGMSR